LRDQLSDQLKAVVHNVVETGVVETAAGTDRSHKIAGSCHLCFAGVESEALLFLLEREGVYASAASSCASGAFEPSHVLAAMGISRELAKGSLRLSLGTCTTQAEIDLACRAIPPAVGQLRKAAA